MYEIMKPIKTLINPVPQALPSVVVTDKMHSRYKYQKGAKQNN